jgi:hypothetical protein
MNLFAEVDGIKTCCTQYDIQKSENFIKARKRIHKDDVCPICNKLIISGRITLLINNHKLFPNIIVHTECCESFDSNEDVVRWLKEDYQEVEKRKAWKQYG